MVVSHKHKYLFISNPKAATNSLYTYLVDHCSGERHGIFHEINDTFPQDYFRFSTCRNPYDRMLSSWYSTCMRGDDIYGYREGCQQNGYNPDIFDDWLKYGAYHTHRNAHLTWPQWYWHRHFHLDRIIKTETLQEDVEGLYFSNGSPVGKENATVGGKREHLTDDSIELINTLYEGDFRIYGYNYIRRTSDSSSKLAGQGND